MRLARRLISSALGAALLLAAPALSSQARPGTLPTATVRAREHFFGAENVGRDGRVRTDRVILSWFSVSSLAMAIDGHVVLLDTYIHKGEDHPNYVPTTTEELVALRPEVIFIGHGHFDHANTAGRMVVQTRALVVGTPEHCDQVRDQANTFAGRTVPVRCLAVVKRGSAPGAEVKEIRPLGRRVAITVLKHVHSAGEPADGDMHETTLVSGAPDPSLLLLYPLGATLIPGADPRGDEGSSLLYQFRVGRFSLTWHDTVGPLREEAPQLLRLFKSLPPTDVHFGATMTPNGVTNGMRDPVDYVEALRSKVFYPIHHDFVAEYGMSKGVEGIFRREMERRGVRSDVRWLYDPYDYLRPRLMTFDTRDPRFAR